MSDAPLDAETAHAQDPHDAFVARARERVSALEELTRIGMTMARALERKAVAEAELAEARARQAESAATAAEPAPAQPAARGPNLDAAFDRVSRSIRLTITLASKMDDALRALLSGEPARVEARRAETARRAKADEEDRQEARRERLRRLVLDAAEFETETAEAFNDIDDAVTERLQDDPAYFDLDRHSDREIVEHLCHDLQLSPDWSRWTGEGWAPFEPFSRPRFSEFNPPGRKPVDWRAHVPAEYRDDDWDDDPAGDDDPPG